MTMTDKQKFKPGTQIIYMPSHAKDENDPVCEQGFVTSVNEKGAFCRYWSKLESGMLRTLANSELTPFDKLTIRNTHLQEEVNILLEGIRKEESPIPEHGGMITRLTEAMAENTTS